MPSHLKERVHARMEKTGESYEQALRHVRAQEDRAPEAAGPPGIPYAKSEERSHSVADTAYAVAMVRAEEALRPEADRLFEDPYARLFTPSEARSREAIARFIDLPFVREGVRLRTRFIDDTVREGIAAGLHQVVILGAGFDTRGLRVRELTERRVAVYEIDTPYQLQRKRAVLAAVGADPHDRITHVPFEFVSQNLEEHLPEALESQGFRPGAGALFVWEGVIGYIDDADMDRSLRFMARAGGRRSRLVFTFGEGSFGRDTAEERTRRAGFASCEEIASDALWRRYLSGDPHPAASLVKVGTAIV